MYRWGCHWPAHARLLHHSLKTSSLTIYIYIYIHIYMHKRSTLVAKKKCFFCPFFHSITLLIQLTPTKKKKYKQNTYKQASLLISLQYISEIFTINICIPTNILWPKNFECIFFDFAKYRYLLKFMEDCVTLWLFSLDFHIAHMRFYNIWLDVCFQSQINVF